MKYVKYLLVFIFITFNSVRAGTDSTFMKAVHLGGNWGRNTFSIQNPPGEYFNYLDSLNANWIGISVSLHISDSMDSTVERVYSGVGIPTFNDEDLINVIREFKNKHFNVYLTLAFEAEEAAHAIHPVSRWQLGDPKMHIESPNIQLDYWPWAPEHPDHVSFVNKFFETYTDQAVHYANICEQEGVAMYSLGTETNRLFRTRTGGYWPNNYLNHLISMVDSVRHVYTGKLTYDMEYGAMTDAGFFMLDSLWKDMDLDAIGISAYFPLSPTMPDTVMSVEQLTQSWNGVFNNYLVPLQQNNPDKPIYFLEFGYVDAVGAPHEPANREFENKVFEDADQNGLDDGEETQANIHSAFFSANQDHGDLVRGAFLWGNQMASDIDWANSFGQLRDFAVRDKLAEDIVSDHYAQYTHIPNTPRLISPDDTYSTSVDTCELIWGSCEHTTSYKIQIAKDSLFSVELKVKGITDTIFIARNIALNIRYYWRVKALNRSIESEWSGLRSFVREEVATENTIPEVFLLRQNYPNPFNPKTAISYQLSADSRVELAIYNILGGKITTLVNEYKPAGYHRINWDASAFPSGVYFYQLTAGNFLDTKKMILIK